MAATVFGATAVGVPADDRPSLTSLVDAVPLIDLRRVSRTFVTDGGVATCLDAVTGRRRWQERLRGTYSASPVYADGRIYFVNEDGVTTVIAPGTEFRSLAINTLEGTTYASPAVVDGSIFIRTASALYRIATIR